VTALTPVPRPSNSTTPVQLPRPTRVLFVDDSGKPDASHQSQYLTIRGISIPSNEVSTFTRRVQAAKGHFYKKRGRPSDWECKSGDILKPNPWKRAYNRNFCDEVARIATTVGATVYSVSICKSNMHNPMTLKQTMPLMMQVLAEHFGAECEALRATGLIVSDWSEQYLDEHLSNCVGSYVATQGLPLHPSVYYASSRATVPIQIADLIAGATRMRLEGASHLAALVDGLARVRLHAPGTFTTHQGRYYENSIKLF
jgi:hypothetical protein